ncbi:MAG: hypothetical protein AAF384_07140 [Pseudomonadota bacterium]
MTLRYLIVALGLSVHSASANSPHVDFMLHCQGCHLADGTGTPGIVPPLVGKLGLFLRTQTGRDYLLRVPGVAQSSLSDERLAAVMNWAVDYFDAPGKPADFEPYSPEEAGKLRSQILRSVKELRIELIGNNAADY